MNSTNPPSPFVIPRASSGEELNQLAQKYAMPSANEEDGRVFRHTQIQPIVTHPNIKEETLMFLAEADDWRVREIVAAYVVAHKRVFFKLCEDQDEDVLRTLAGNPKVPSDVLDYMAHNEVTPWGAIERVAKHPNVMGATLVYIHQLLVHELPGSSYLQNTLTTMAGHDSCPAELLAVLARDKSPEVRLAVAENPNTPPAIRQRMPPASRGTITLSDDEREDLLQKLTGYRVAEYREILANEGASTMLSDLFQRGYEGHNQLSDGALHNLAITYELLDEGEGDVSQAKPAHKP